MSGFPRDWKIQIIMVTISKHIIVIITRNYSIDGCYKLERKVLLMLTFDFHTNKHEGF